MGKTPTTEQQNDLIARYPGEEMSTQDIVEAGKAIGLSLAPYEISLAEIQSRGRPAIIHSKGGHFTLLIAIRDNQATVVDCSVNELAIPLDLLKETYSGKALLPE